MTTKRPVQRSVPRGSSGTTPLTVAVWQAAGTPADVAANLAGLARAAEQARSSGAELLITPEMYISGYELDERLPEVATVDFLTPVRSLAKDLGIAIVLGGPDLAPEGIYNAAYFIDDAGARPRNRRRCPLKHRDCWSSPQERTQTCS